MSEWKKYKLSEVVLFNPKEIIAKGTIAPKVAMEHLQPFTREIYRYESTTFSGGSKFRNGDTIMARITPCLENGKTAFVSILKEDEVGFGSTEYIVLRNIKGITDSKYIYYFVTSPWFRNIAIKSMVGSSGRQRVQLSVLESLEITLPPLEEQKQIARILSALDDKIELNRRINENLEQQAQALFKHWFVDFEFPNAEGKPYKSAGGNLVDSELGAIPEGWKVGQLADICEIVGGGTPSKSQKEYFTPKDIAWITPKDLSNTKYKFISKGETEISKLGYNNSSAKLMPRGSVLFSSRAPIGYVAIAQNSLCTNQGFKSAIPTIAGTAYLYYYLKEHTPEIESKASGSTFKEASGSLMKSLSTVIPPQKVLNAFEHLIQPIFDKQEQNENENKRLVELRDTLLPKLMNGEIYL